MVEQNEIINAFRSDSKYKDSISFKNKIYSDEPIIRPSSQLPNKEVPTKIKEMKGLVFTPEAYWKTSSWLFYTQGKFMEKYEDDFEYHNDFVKYYPSYRDLTTEQIRGYFSWRTKIRNNQTEKAPLPFVYIYIYELINCIGYNDPQECFEKLNIFVKKYTLIDESITRYTDQWLKDFIVYYGLDNALADEIPEICFDKHLITLIKWEQSSDEEIFEAINALSSYQLKKSLYYTAFPENFRIVLVKSFIRLSEFFRDKRKNSLCSKLFGNIVECSYNIFASAIFYDRQPLRNCEYVLNEIHSFSCRNGKWSCRKFYGNRNRNSHLGDFVKAVDSLLREKNDFKYKISFSGISKKSITIIKSEIDAIDAQKKKEEIRKISFDLSKLGEIRKSAENTMNRLLIDGNEEEESTADTAVSPLQSSENNSSILEHEEIIFLQCLLYNRTYTDSRKKTSKMPSIIADSINEKLFDIFGDTVIDFLSDDPCVIENYIEELKKMIPKEKI